MTNIVLSCSAQDYAVEMIEIEAKMSPNVYAQSFDNRLGNEALDWVDETEVAIVQGSQDTMEFKHKHIQNTRV